MPVHVIIANPENDVPLLEEHIRITPKPRTISLFCLKLTWTQVYSIAATLAAVSAFGVNFYSYRQGFNTGFDEGILLGNQTFNSGLQLGYGSGLAKGLQEGYDNGFTKALDEAYSYDLSEDPDQSHLCKKAPTWKDKAIPSKDIGNLVYNGYPGWHELRYIDRCLVNSTLAKYYQHSFWVQAGDRWLGAIPVYAESVDSAREQLKSAYAKGLLNYSNGVCTLSPTHTNENQIGTYCLFGSKQKRNPKKPPEIDFCNDGIQIMKLDFNPSNHHAAASKFFKEHNHEARVVVDPEEKFLASRKVKKVF